MQKEIKIFLASSEELKQDRESFGNLIRQLDVDFEQKSGLRIRLLMWEDFDSAYNCVRKQEEYNTKVRECDVFVALFYKKAGRFTREEFDVAAQKREKEGKPIIYVYTRELSESDELSEELNIFMNELHNIKEHFVCTYINADMLKLQFRGLIYAQYGVMAPELRIKNSEIYQDNTYVASMNQLPCVANNNRMSTLKEELSKVEKAILKFESVLELDDDNGTFANVLKQHQKKRDDLVVDIETHEKMLLSTVVSIFDKQLEESSSRYLLAIKAFNEGDISCINQILDINTLRNEADITIKEMNNGRNVLNSLINQLLFKIKINLLSNSTTSKCRDVSEMYDICLGYARNPIVSLAKLADVISDYAFFLQSFNRFNKAITLYEEELKIRKEIYIRENQQIHNILFIQNNLGVLYSSIKMNDMSLKYYLEAYSVYKSFSVDMQNKYIEDIALLENNIGVIYDLLCLYSDANKFLSLALYKRRNLVRTNKCKHMKDLAMTQNNISILYSNLARYNEAIEMCKEAISSYELINNNDCFLPNISQCTNNLAILYKNIGEYNLAEELYMEALNSRIILAEIEPDIYLHKVALTSVNLGILYETNLINYKQAQAYYLKAVDIYIELSEEQPDVYLSELEKAIYNLYDICIKIGDIHTAKKLINNLTAFKHSIN